MENRDEYFTQIEERFQQRRGRVNLFSATEFALIESWERTGIPLEAALRGIDDVFDKYGQSKRINSVAYCSQSVLAAAEKMKGRKNPS